jgi:hypothetical protein
MSAAVGEALVRHGHSVTDMLALGLPPAADPKTVVEMAKAAQLDICTSDAVLSAAPFLLKFWFNRSIVYLQLEGGEVEQDDAIDRLFARYKRLTPGRLYTVTNSRVKVRQLPQRFEEVG